MSPPPGKSDEAVSEPAPPSRSRRFFHAVWSGQLNMVVVSVINLATIPVMLAVLGKSTFGLWTAVLQITLLANIFDLGLGPSLARFITDYKDHRDPMVYGGFLKSVFFVAVLQGLLFAGGAVLLLPVLPQLMGIGADQAPLFKTLVALQLGSVALGFPLRPLSQLLYSNQQIAATNACTILAATAGGATLLIGLKAGWGIYAGPVSTWVTFLVTNAGLVYVVVNRRVLPPLRQARVCLKSLAPLAQFTGNVFLIAVGLQLINFAPSLLITRQLGLQALADWSIGTRLMVFVWQLVSRISSSSEPAFWEMFSRNEMARVRQRLMDLIQLSGSAAAVLAAGIAAINPPFIHVWTSGRVRWETTTDLVLVLWVAVLTAATVFNMVPGMTKRLGNMKFVYFSEGFLLIGLACVAMLHWQHHWQVALLLLICVSLFRLPYGLARAVSDLQLPGRLLAGTLVQLGVMLAALLAVSLALRLATASLNPWAQLAINGIGYSLVALPVFYRFGLPGDARAQVNLQLNRAGLKRG